MLLRQRAEAHPDCYEVDPPAGVVGQFSQPLTVPAEAGAATVVDEDDDGARFVASALPEPRGALPGLAPEACLVGVRDRGALSWAGLAPGSWLVQAVESLWAQLSVDLDAACRSTDSALPASDPATVTTTTTTTSTSSAAAEWADNPGGVSLDDAPRPAERADTDAEQVNGDPVDVQPADTDVSGEDSRAGTGEGSLREEPASSVVSDAELVEAVAACERQLAALAARRDQLAGVFAARRRAEAEQDVADARAATARDGKGRPWATQVRSTAASELCARLGIGSAAADALVERGLAALGAHREVAAAMAAGVLPAGAGTWMLEQLTAVGATAYLSALERETAAREEALNQARAVEDEVRAETGQAPLTGEELRARAVADRADVDAAAEAAAREHAERVAAAVRRELLGKATGSDTWPTDSPTDSPTDGSAAGLDDAGAQGSSPSSSPSPDAAGSRPSAGAGLGPNRRAWTKRLNTAVHRIDPDAAQARAAKARAGCSTSRWSEADGQAGLQLRGPA
ncbi:hypothetical protein SAMN06264364_1451, partial [Quadrisphaera granulorum]